MSSGEKAQAVRELLLLSDPRQLGPEYNAFREALRTELDKPLNEAVIERLYAALPTRV